MDLEQALAIEDPTERMLSVVAVIAEAVRELGLTPVVVGGLAVQFWTYGEYTTGDIDVLLPSTPDVHERLRALGFVRDGRHWVLPGRDLFVEAPGSFAAPTEASEDVELPSGATVTVLRPEDLLMYRLHEFVATGHRDAASQSVSLYASAELDHERVNARAAEEGLSTALAELERLSERIESGERVETWDLHDIARSSGSAVTITEMALRFSDWLKQRSAGRAKVARIEAAFSEPYRRERPRDPEEARLLRERGTPENLIGPES